ncbi:MAG TPA: carboxypeptidase-like regulatory domain-containing protein [Longimicrobiaceae bacterium]|jgi:anti-sigma factor RsiW
MRHVDEGLLHAWLDGERAALEPGTADEVRRHLAECGECRARLEEARGLRDRAAALLRGGSPLVVEVPPFESLAARPAPARPGRGRMLAWAASLALALGAGWLARAALDPGEPPARTAAAPRPAVPAVVSPRAPADASPTSTVGASATTAETALSERTAAPQPVTEPSLRVAAREEGRVEPAGAPPAVVMPDVSLPPPPPPPLAAAESGAPAPARETAAPAAADVAAGALEGRAAGVVVAPQARTARRPERAAPSAPARARADSAGAGSPAFGSEAVALEGVVVTAAGSAGGLAGAEVRVAGTQARTVTGPDGTYRLAVPRDAVRDGKVAVEARLLGYEPLRQEVRVAGGEVRVDLRLHSSALALDALVVTGTGAEAGVLAGATGPDAEGWFGVRPDAPRRLLGREPLRVRGLPTVSVQAGRLEGRTVVRVRQRLAGGGILSLVQEPARPAAAAAQADSTSLPEARDEGPAEQVRLVRRVGGITVTASAPLPARELSRLLDALR